MRNFGDDERETAMILRPDENELYDILTRPEFILPSVGRVIESWDHRSIFVLQKENFRPAASLYYYNGWWARSGSEQRRSDDVPCILREGSPASGLRAIEVIETRGNFVFGILSERFSSPQLKPGMEIKRGMAFWRDYFYPGKNYRLWLVWSSVAEEFQVRENASSYQSVRATMKVENPDWNLFRVTHVKPDVVFGRGIRRNLFSER